MRSLLLHPLAKPLVFLLCLLPLAWLVYGAVANQLGANPAEALIRGLGDWALRFLCIALAVTPVRIHTRTPQLARYRRMLGLFVAFYASLHLVAYAWLDMGLDVADIGRDILKRPFILVGFTAWLLLVPLALTSTNGAVQERLCRGGGVRGDPRRAAARPAQPLLQAKNAASGRQISASCYL